MVDNSISIGVLGIQGAVSEHVLMMKQVLTKKNKQPNVTIIRNKAELDTIQGLIIPGGESTTISRFLLRKHLHKEIIHRAEENTLAVMGTCAGCVLVASDIKDTSKDISLLSLMDMKVERNAFGRQRESFERNIQISGMKDPFPAVFIRAPLILQIWGRCTPLSQTDEGIVMAQQDNILGLSFHPELTSDLRIHNHFYQMTKKTK